MRCTTLARLVLALGSMATCVQALVELDAHTLPAAIASRDTRDVLIAFTSSSTSACGAPCDHLQTVLADVSDTLQRHGVDVVTVATYNMTAFGNPTWTHFHHLPALLLFRPGADTFEEYDWTADPLSDTLHASDTQETPTRESHAAHKEHGTCSHAHAKVDAHGHVQQPNEQVQHEHTGSCAAGGHDHDHDHDHDHHHHHEHAHGDARSRTAPSLAGVLTFLKQHSTFSAEIPRVTMSQRWRGRNLLPALQDGLLAVAEQMAELRAENAELRASVASLQQRLACCRASGGTTRCPASPTPTPREGGNV